MVKSAFLRVYVPADLATSSLVSLPEVPAATSWPLRRGRYGLLDEPLDEVVYRIDWKGSRYLCPRYTRLRMLEGVVAFYNAYLEIGSQHLIPESVAGRAASELSSLHDRAPQQHSHILTSPWHVPLRWFVLFDPPERTVEDRPTGLSVVYRTSMADATRRADEAEEILRDVDMDEAVIADLAELRSWLDDFPPGSLVELDYGTVATMFEPGDLALDESAADVWASLRALAADEWEEAARHYGEVASRWSTPMAVTFSN